MATKDFEEWIAIDDNVNVAKSLPKEDICEMYHYRLLMKTNMQM